MVFLQKGTEHEIPPNAILLTPTQALTYQLENIDSLSYKDTWPLLFSRKIVAMAVGVQAAYMISRFQRKLGLRNYGMLTLFLPFAGGPAIFTSLFHDKFITRPLILENECSICLLTRSVAVNTILGNIFPALGGGVASLWYAHNYGTYTLPALKWENLSTFSKKVISINKPLIPFHWMMLAIHIFLSYGVISFQQNTIVKINKIFEEQDEELAKQTYFRERRRRSYNV